LSNVSEDAKVKLLPTNGQVPLTIHEAYFTKNKVHNEDLCYSTAAFSTISL